MRTGLAAPARQVSADRARALAAAGAGPGHAATITICAAGHRLARRPSAQPGPAWSPATHRQ